LIPWAICSPFSVSSSLGCRGGALPNIPCSCCGTLFSQHGMVQRYRHYQAY
jgi:hypothetical protein